MFIYSDTAPPSSCRDLLIEQLMREIVELKERIQDLEGQVQADYELIGSVRQQMEQVRSEWSRQAVRWIWLLQKTRELEDYKEVAEQATLVSGTTLSWVVETLAFIKIKENELLKNQLESCQSGQGAQAEAIEGKQIAHLLILFILLTLSFSLFLSLFSKS